MSEEGEESAVVPGRHVRVDDRRQAQAGHDDAEAGDALGDADWGWHDGGGNTGADQAAGGWRPQMLAGAAFIILIQPHTQCTAQYFRGSDQNTLHSQSPMLFCFKTDTTSHIS